MMKKRCEIEGGGQINECNGNKLMATTTTPLYLVLNLMEKATQIP